MPKFNYTTHIIRLDNGSSVGFTAHNIRLDDGSYTKPDVQVSMEKTPYFIAAKNILETVFPGDKKRVRLADVGCLEGGYAVEFARVGFNVLGIEIRESNFAACNFVKSKTNLPNLQFVKDDAWNITRYGMFDAIFCSGLLYHLDKPKQFLHTLSGITNKIVILQTHFATEIMDLSDNEGLRGSWDQEFADEESFMKRETERWSSWDNRRSFLIQREYLLQAIKDSGFDIVLEQFDSLEPSIVESMLKGYYHTQKRGTFIGIKAG